MTKRMILPLLFGLIGCGILVSLGTWQVKRLAWKEATLSEIDARISAEPVALPVSFDREGDLYLPVEATGSFGADRIRVLVSQKKVGAGYRIISPFTTQGRTIMVDRGVIPIADDLPATPQGEVTVTGNLHWPNEVDSYTPEPDEARDIWFARDVDRMAAKLGTEPVLLILRAATPATLEITPLPVSRAGIPNDHLSYAITWFSLAGIWFGMTVFLLWRIRQRTV
ncbi:surfeit locus 1 family protein [Litoreibacter halocynthiae]|uniref:SURF1-like protein n=1 Tax=Litoreibacter halocynthiae TaxID=1242689 RepID=A0A4V3EW13_9RHOB|nr:SURF1 family protein [Litoreibacter halocynthiae]TDT75265.1 surfeit locus 1 family protein [Litoreibacter halocynthiae]